ncbi:MAG: hemolysin family protein [Acidimicrobiales bacterium]
MTVWRVAGLIGAVMAIAALAVLTVAETALLATARARANLFAEEHRRGAVEFLALLARRERVLHSLTLARVAGLISAPLLAWFAAAPFGPAPAAGAAGGAAVLGALLGVAAARTYALTRVEAAVALTPPVVRWLNKLPFVRIPGALSWRLCRRLLPAPERRDAGDGEQQTADGAPSAGERAEEDEDELLVSIHDFAHTIVREVMVPRPDMVTIPAEFRVHDVMELAVFNGFSRFPVTGEGIDDIVGVAFAKDLMRAELDHGGARAVRDVMREVRFVPETKRVADLLRDMQDETFHLAVVIDEYGGTAGLVTLEDLIEELVGEITDEFDFAEALVEDLPGGAVRVAGRSPVWEVNDHLGDALPEGDWDTVGGFVFSSFGYVPKAGESIMVGGRRLVVERVAGRRIQRVVIEPVLAGGEGGR